jgi:uncharacterized membrane protein YgaE (UPF0421/DUF939 family)
MPSGVITGITISILFLLMERMLRLFQENVHEAVGQYRAVRRQNLLSEAEQIGLSDLLHMD